jgi:DNA polymerase-3 subunit alpha
MDKEREKFVAGCVAQSLGEKLGRELWDAVEPFAGYGFNKSHSAAYGYVAYQTAWLKANHPAEYMAALLTSTKRDKDRTAIYLNECRAMGIKVMVPDVNRSDMDFNVRDGAITFGLSAIRNVGEGVVEKILEERTAEGVFESFQDFVNRVDPSALNKRTVESLIKAGAFDSVAPTRRGLLLVFEQILETTLSRRRNEDMGQFSLFGAADGVGETELVAIPDLSWDKRTRLSFEKEMLGLYVSDHPLFGVEHALRQAVTAGISSLPEQADGSTVTIGGLVGSITRRFTRKGDPMLFFQVEDLEGSVEVVGFPKVVMETGPMIREDAIVIITGRVDNRGDEVKIIAQEVREPELSSETAVRLEVPATQLSPNMVERLKEILVNHPGTAPVYLHMTSGSGHKVWKLSDEHRVEPRTALYAELRELLGQKAIV